jgi:hypothetical protein
VALLRYGIWKKICFPSFTLPSIMKSRKM